MNLPFDLETEVARLIRNKSIELPTYPGVALKLQRLLSSGDFGLDALAKLVQADQALATNTMRAANSAFYRAAAPVTTLQAAISRIGAKELGNIAIAGTLGLSANDTGPLAALRQDSWRASLVSALVCQELARQRRVDPGEAFLAGLLHDFGETIAYACFEAILEAHPEVEPQHAASWQWEGQRHHVELGATLAADWKLPPFVLEVIEHHLAADVSACRYPDLVKLVNASDAVTMRLLEAPSLEAARLDDLPALSKDEVAKLEALVPRIPAFLKSFDDAMADVPSLEAASLVKQPATTLKGDVRELRFPVRVGKKGEHQESFHAVAWCETGLRIEGAHPLPERHLVTLELEGLKLFAMVTLCSASDRGCVVELKPFAMDRQLTAAWLALGAPRAAA
ncbi:MAG: HDOD domain-containing protein [Myxococcota bacterium]